MSNLCIHLFVSSEGLKYFIVLIRVNALVKHKRKLDCDLRRQLGTDEADIAAKHVQLLSEADSCFKFHLPNNASSALDGSDTGATPSSSPSSNWESDT